MVWNRTLPPLCIGDAECFAHFSQLYAKSSYPYIYSISMQATTAGEDQGVYSQFNDTAIKMCWELNSRRNARFSAVIAKRTNNVLSDYL